MLNVWKVSRNSVFGHFSRSVSNLKVLQNSEYPNESCCKLFAEQLLMNSGKHGNKWVHWYEMGYVSSKYASLHFIIQRQFSLFSFSSKKDIFFHSGHHPYRRYCHIVKKKYWLCLFSKMLNRIFVLLEMLYQYLATVIIRGVIRTLLNMMKFFVKIGYSF